jgi:hypothetical protein
MRSTRPNDRWHRRLARSAAAIALSATLAACSLWSSAPEEPPTPTPKPGEVLPCASLNGGYQTCPARTRISRVELEQEQSKGLCKQRQTWGFTGTDVWVDGGCRGVFRVFPTRY